MRYGEMNEKLAEHIDGHNSYSVLSTEHSCVVSAFYKMWSLTRVNPELQSIIMTNEAREIEEKALSLPAEDRETLANHLFQSVHNQELNENDEAWLTIAEERWNSYKSNPDLGIKKEEFFSQIRDSLGWA